VPPAVICCPQVPSTRAPVNSLPVLLPLINHYRILFRCLIVSTRQEFRMHPKATAWLYCIKQKRHRRIFDTTLAILVVVPVPTQPLLKTSRSRQQSNIGAHAAGEHRTLHFRVITQDAGSGNDYRFRKGGPFLFFPTSNAISHCPLSWFQL